MDIITIVIIALGLSVDSLAVSVTSGITIKKFQLSSILKIALFLAFFQGIMPIIGWLVGMSFIDYIAEYDHWIAFGILLLLGIKMIYDGLTNNKGENKVVNPLKILVLISLGLATSIDALAVGVGFAFLDVSIIISAVIIFLITFVVSFFGVYFGLRLSQNPRLNLEIIGGIVLIGIGSKILIEHTIYQ